MSESQGAISAIRSLFCLADCISPHRDWLA